MKLDSECHTGKVTWIHPEEERAISFTDRKRSFKVCLDSARSGASVYRLEGSAKTLLSSNSESGGIKCQESDCKHVTFLLQPSTNDTLEYSYTTSITNGKGLCRCKSIAMHNYSVLCLQFAPSAPQNVRGNVSAIVHMVSNALYPQ